MQAVTVDNVGLQAFLPHRGVNLLPDSLEMNAERSESWTRTRVPSEDPRGRRLFARSAADSDLAYWYEPFLFELMALTGVPLRTESLAPEGRTSVFSMLSRTTLARLPRMDEDVVGHTTLIRERADFAIFHCQGFVGDEQIIDSEVMSGSAPFGELTKIAATPFAQEPEGETVLPFTWKDPALTFVDGISAVETANGRLEAWYTYPKQHPLVPGHFPDAAVMMGVSQLAALVDAGTLAADRCAYDGAFVINGTIRKADGSEVIDLRDCRIEREGCTPRIAAVKRIAFRAPVCPGDGLIIDVTVRPADA